jgi:hypothetical protein
MLMVINVPVEIFVIKRLSVLNLVVISSRKADEGHKEIAFIQSEKTATLRLQELAQSSIVSGVKGIVALLTVAGALTNAACTFFEPGEAVREESGRTLYRAAEENPTDRPDVTPLREKVPGETR